MLDLVLPSYGFNLQYAQKLVADVPEDQMCAQPVAGRTMNHAAFILGHLAWASDNGSRLLGLDPAVTKEWKDQFGMGAQPVADRERYPSKEVLLKALEDAHSRLADAISKASPETLTQPAPERMRGRFATLGPLLFGLMTAHEASHLGQLSAWRRALGLPSVF